MSFISNLTFSEFNEYISKIFDLIIKKVRADSGSILVLDENENIIYKAEKNLTIEIEKISVGEIDRLVSRMKKPVILEDLSEFPDLKGKKREEIKSSIIFPMYFKDKLIGFLNLNRKNSSFINKDIEIIKEQEVFLIPTIYNIVLLEEINKERRKFNRFIIALKIMIDSYSNSKNTFEFLGKVLSAVKKELNAKITFVFHDSQYTGKGIRFGDKVLEIVYGENYDIEYVEKIEEFFKSILLLKHLEEITKTIDVYSENSKEILMMNFVSWELLQEVNSTLTSLNMIAFMLKDKDPRLAENIKETVKRLQSASDKYKSKFFKDKKIELVDIYDLLEDIGKRIKIFLPDIDFKILNIFHTKIYFQKEIISNAFFSIFLTILKDLKTDKNISFEISHEKISLREIKVIITAYPINMSISEEKIKELFKIPFGIFENYHIKSNVQINEDKIILDFIIPKK
ncbi:hypothetical protein XO10_01335 [Marinitoga sp. 1135]|uniref:GAF domain-containing protein n=1 Tax=Marinitoga piezophila (strain DSM 14283 / JCM 11233 / KA3) TaxID=443254 RepID=H2J3L6_MARPK|nr:MULTISPECIES: GAF domain-containing protein [Marinitoga]AEX84660.1 hypothetical protein Marpi_0205 [Marinitoga piezophila KA3]NUU94948.1 hypothetical protein [Marinitoga sp. 1135]